MDGDATNMTAAERWLYLLEKLPPERRTAILDQAAPIIEEAAAIEKTFSEEEARRQAADERVRQLRAELWRVTISSAKQRMQQLLNSYITLPLMIYNRSREVRELDGNIEKRTAIIEQSSRLALGGPAEVEAPAWLGWWNSRIARHRQRLLIRALAESWRELHQANRKLVSPFGLMLNLLRFEARRHASTTFRFGTMIAFGMAIFILAGLVHNLHHSDDAWLLSLVSIPLTVAAVELGIHRVADKYFERWAHRERLRLNDLLWKARLNAATDVAMVPSIPARR